MNVTGAGILRGFIAIEKPSTKFDESGIYSCQLDLTGDAAKDMKNDVDKYLDDALKNGKDRDVKRKANPPYTIADGILTVKFKQKAQIKSKTGQIYDLHIDIYDAKGNKVEEQLMIGEGTRCRVAYKPYLWAVAALGCGCTLQLSMVQILDLVTRDGAGGGGNPFNIEEGSFAAANKDSNPFEDNKTEELPDSELGGDF